MKIALTKTEANFDKYTAWLDSFNINYEVLDFEKHETDINKINDCSGLILSGGVDIYPEIYCDWDTVETKGTYNPERDGFELMVLQKAIEKKIPILAICRGLELVNVFYRGSLIFDLMEIRNVDHTRISDTEDRMHSVNIFKDTLLYEITNTAKGIVNSSHHQAIDRVGEGLMINAKSDDGIVEGIEYADKTNKPFLIGVQWHPERLKDKDAVSSKKILDKFISECNNVS